MGIDLKDLATNQTIVLKNYAAMRGFIEEVSAAFGKTYEVADIVTDWTGEMDLTRVREDFLSIAQELEEEHNTEEGTDV